MLRDAATKLFLSDFMGFVEYLYQQLQAGYGTGKLHDQPFFDEKYDEEEERNQHNKYGYGQTPPKPHLDTCVEWVARNPICIIFLLCVSAVLIALPTYAAIGYAHVDEIPAARIDDGWTNLPPHFYPPVTTPEDVFKINKPKRVALATLFKKLGKDASIFEDPVF
ncbi:hypothetical protein TWF694_000343 [Orbilia ellipsospora]|uniref:Uncharacterized protein n=1 Tax=Orbilia ellipsospora TaxID=2528407 RepID=A0AAV9XNS6_9PEZI